MGNICQDFRFLFPKKEIFEKFSHAKRKFFKKSSYIADLLHLRTNDGKNDDRKSIDGK